MKKLAYVEDYRWLKNRGYPEKAALKLVGDRYRLNATQRNCLFRGVAADSICLNRKQKLTSPQSVKGCPLGVDWYNVLITIESYLKGHTIFLSDDGILRDSAGIHGSYRTSQATPQARKAIIAEIVRLEPENLALFLDSPIPFSGRMADNLRTDLESCLSIPFVVTVVPSADYSLKSFSGIVATSDSTIVDTNTLSKVFDLARYVLEQAFHYRAQTLPQVLKES